MRLPERVELAGSHNGRADVERSRAHRPRARVGQAARQVCSRQELLGAGGEEWAAELTGAHPRLSLHLRAEAPLEVPVAVAADLVHVLGVCSVRSMACALRAGDLALE